MSNCPLLSYYLYTKLLKWDLWNKKIKMSRKAKRMWKFHPFFIFDVMNSNYFFLQYLFFVLRWSSKTAFIWKLKYLINQYLPLSIFAAASTASTTKEPNYFQKHCWWLSKPWINMKNWHIHCWFCSQRLLPFWITNNSKFEENEGCKAWSIHLCYTLMCSYFQAIPWH